MAEKKSILIVDDENDTRTELSMTLNNWGYNVSTVDNGKEALYFIKENACDIVLSDLRLTDISGIDLLKEIKKLAPDTGTFILTAYGEVNSYLEAMNLGAIDYFNKPVNPDKLKQVITKFLKKEH